MKVDMSPGAVTGRLRTMDELWLLSVKLMNSKKLKSAEVDIKSGVSIDEPTENISLVQETLSKGE